MIDHELTIYSFLEYAKEYDDSDNNIERKILHTLRVAAAAGRIAEALKMNEEDRDLAWFIGILHDVGRFEQERRYGTFVDRDSVDHAELGADILFKDGVVDRFPSDGLTADWRRLCETAVRLHNKLSLPQGLDERTELFCRLIRDADKVDIFRVIATTSFIDRIGTSRKNYTDAPKASPKVMEYAYRHCCVPRKYVSSCFDSLIANCCNAFELDFEISRQIAKEQGFLNRLFSNREGPDRHEWNEQQCEQLQIVKHELEKAWDMKLD